MISFLATVVYMGVLANALPLNINLGAYSPALVVGDGEISFNGEQDVSKLMNVLEGAAVNTATGVANGAAITTSKSAATENVAAPGEDPTVVSAAATAADPALQEQAQQIAALKGLANKSVASKEIDPRLPLVDTTTEEPVKSKRDIAGFDRALKFAETALEKGPKVQLGTGKEGSGVGIIVDNNKEAAARAGTGTVGKRDEASAPKKVRAKVTTMYVRSGVPASLQSRNVERDVVLSTEHTVNEARSQVVRGLDAVPQVAYRRDALDAVNLNVDGDQGLTMTFVETVDDEDDDLE